MKWVSWKPEVVQTLKGRDVLTRGSQDGGEPGTDMELVTPGRGGTVGGDGTFGNTVTIPRHALKNAEEITVKVACVNGDDQCAAGVDFLPTMEFQSDVTITLSWSFVNTGGGELGLDFKVYYSEDGGETWYEVSDVVVDHDEQTISVEVDHFTRFAWAL
ncbi:MAG: hypothetical protein ACE5LH_01160 [Fidelibacterota bacterium]